MMENSTVLTSEKTSFKFKVGDIVIMPKDWDKEKKYIILSCTDNSSKIVSSIKRSSRIYKVKVISDSKILEEPEEYFELAERS